VADWEKDSDGLVTYYGYGRVLDDGKLKEILLELASGASAQAVAEKRKLNVRIVKDIIKYFQEHSG